MATADFTKLNPRKLKYIEARSRGLSKRESKNLAGYAATTNTYSVENSSVKAALARLIRQAVPAHVLVQRIAEGVSAEETKFFQKEGIVTDQRNVVAWSERREYLKLAAEYGQYVDPKGGDQEAKSNVSVGFTLINGITSPRDRTRAPESKHPIVVDNEVVGRHPSDDQGEKQVSTFSLVNTVTRPREGDL